MFSSSRWCRRLSASTLAQCLSFQRCASCELLFLLTTLVIPHHTIVARYYGFTLDACVSGRPSVSRRSEHPYFVS